MSAGANLTLESLQTHPTAMPTTHLEVPLPSESRSGSPSEKRTIPLSPTKADGPLIKRRPSPSPAHDGPSPSQLTLPPFGVSSGASILPPTQSTDPTTKREAAINAEQQRATLNSLADTDPVPSRPTSPTCLLVCNPNSGNLEPNSISDGVQFVTVQSVVSTAAAHTFRVARMNEFRTFEMVKISRHHSPALSHELDFLKRVRNLDNASQISFPYHIREFIFKDRLSAVFEVRGVTFSEYIQDPSWQSLSLSQITQILKEMAEILTVLHASGIEHGNITPDVISFVSDDFQIVAPTQPSPTRKLVNIKISLGDWAYASVGGQPLKVAHVNKAYRPMETILGFTKVFGGADTYGAGLSVLELASKQPIYATKNLTDPEQIAAMVEVVGRFNAGMKQATAGSEHCRGLCNIIGEVRELLEEKRIVPLSTLLDWNSKDAAVLNRLFQAFLCHDATRRVTAAAALKQFKKKKGRKA